MVAGRSGLLPWARHQERNTGHSNHCTLYPGKPRAGQGKAQIGEGIEAGIPLGKVLGTLWSNRRGYREEDNA